MGLSRLSLLERDSNNLRIQSWNPITLGTESVRERAMLRKHEDQINYCCYTLEVRIVLSRSEDGKIVGMGTVDRQGPDNE